MRIKVVLTLLLLNSFSLNANALYQAHLNQSVNLAGNISTVGSDTLAGLMTDWAALYKSFYPLVNVQIQTAGSTSAVAALIESTAQIGSMSRAINKSEINQFERKYGYSPQEIIIGIDVIALYVNKYNPLKTITLSDIDAMFSRSPNCKASKNIDYWGELGLKGSWQHRPIQLFGRSGISGTHDFFKNTLLCGSSFKSKVNALASSASVVQAVSLSLNSIGYAGVSYQAAGAKMLPINIEGENVTASAQNVISGAYPLSRKLYVYVNKKPNQPLALKEAEFIKLMLSKQGQSIVAAHGFIPLSETMVNTQLKRLGLSSQDLN